MSSKYKINYLPLPKEDTTSSSHVMEQGLTVKEAFWDNNLSLLVCTAMIQGKDLIEISKHNIHYSLYGKYLGGFCFEKFEFLPPLCILNIISEGVPYNAVFYNNKIYDPKLGEYNVKQYKNINLQIQSYIQIFIEEAYEGLEWQPIIPIQVQQELENDNQLLDKFHSVSPMQQSKIINYCYPFSKASSLNERRTSSDTLKPKQVESILNHIRAIHYDKICDGKSVWDELYDFETKEAVETLKKCGLSEGMTVLDMGCGYAHYTIPAAIITGDKGKIIAVDKALKVLKEAKKRVEGFNLQNITMLSTDEKGLSQYANSLDFIILYDVLHGIVSDHSNIDIKIEFIATLATLLKCGAILSLALYNEIEHKTDSMNDRKAALTHEEAIKPYISLITSCGFSLNNVIENGGVHFDDFHSSYHWRKYGEVRVSHLERRNIYNFVKN